MLIGSLLNNKISIFQNFDTFTSKIFCADFNINIDSEKSWMQILQNFAVACVRCVFIKSHTAFSLGALTC